jgi:hypothetical protein
MDIFSSDKDVTAMFKVPLAVNDQEVEGDIISLSSAVQMALASSFIDPDSVTLDLSTGTEKEIVIVLFTPLEERNPLSITENVLSFKAILLLKISLHPYRIVKIIDRIIEIFFIILLSLLHQ